MPKQFLFIYYFIFPVTDGTHRNFISLSIGWHNTAIGHIHCLTDNTFHNTCNSDVIAGTKANGMLQYYCIRRKRKKPLPVLCVYIQHSGNSTIWHYHFNIVGVALVHPEPLLAGKHFKIPRIKSD